VAPLPTDRMPLGDVDWSDTGPRKYIVYRVLRNH
jgi:hypothetical protein